MTAVNVATAMQMQQIRSDLEVLGVRMKGTTADLEQIGKVLAHVGDPELTVDALLMRPRPPWLRGLIGSDLSAPLSWPRPDHASDGRGSE